MPTENAAASGQGISSATMRHYRQSLAILVAGVVLFVAVIAFASLGTWTGYYPTSGIGPIVLATDCLGSVGFAMIFVGAIWASENRSLLRKSRPNA
jgi:uncharacterized membrane protein YfcA